MVSYASVCCVYCVFVYGLFFFARCGCVVCFGGYCVMLYELVLCVSCCVCSRVRLCLMRCAVFLIICPLFCRVCLLVCSFCVFVCVWVWCV